MPRVIGPTPAAAAKSTVDPGARGQFMAIPSPNVEPVLLPGALRNEGLAGTRHHLDATETFP